MTIAYLLGRFLIAARRLRGLVYNPVRGLSADDDVDRLCLSYRPVIRGIAAGLGFTHRVPHHLISIDDAMQAGYLGLMTAIGRYRDDQGTSFETYARMKIRYQMLEALRSATARSRSVHTVRLGDDEWDLHESTTLETPDNLLHALEGIRRARDADPRRWHALMLTRVGGLTLKDVGTIMGVNFTRVWQLAKEAENTLRRVLG